MYAHLLLGGEKQSVQYVSSLKHTSTMIHLARLRRLRLVHSPCMPDSNGSARASTAAPFHPELHGSNFFEFMTFTINPQLLVEKENVKGVIAMNEDYELKRFVTTEEEWAKLGADIIQLPTVDFTEAPSIDKLELGVKFIMEHAAKQESVYVHCKAGRTRSATLVGCYLMQVHKWTPQEAQIFMQTKRHHIVMKDKHFRAMYRYYDKHVKGQRGGQRVDLAPDTA